MRVGVIGRGFGERVVAPSFAATDGCEVVDVVSPRDEAAVRAVCSRRDVDLVSVHSPPFLHRRDVTWALEAGKAVLCDKPFGCDSAEAAAMVADAEAAGAVALLNFEFRHAPARRRLLELVTGGAVGGVEHVQWTHLSAGSRVPLRRHGWLFERDKGGGWIGAWGSHTVDAVRWLVGDVVEAVATLRIDIPERPGPDGALVTCDAEDGFTASLRTDLGVTVAIDTTFAAAVSLAPRVTVAGSDGVIECVGDATLRVRGADGTRTEIDVPRAEGDPHTAPMRAWAAKVRDAVRDGRTVAPSFADGLACARVLDRLRAGEVSRRARGEPASPARS